MHRLRNGCCAVLMSVVLLLATLSARAGDEGPSQSAAEASRPKRVLLLGQGPDGHAYTTHEYVAGLNILAKTLQGNSALQLVPVRADEPWKEGPELIDGADAVVIFLSEGARWIHQDPARLAALQNLAARGGGFVGLHWGIGCRDAEFIDEYVKLVGGCHGGPDRKHSVLEVTMSPVRPSHPILNGIEPLTVRDEFYYSLKFPTGSAQPVPLLQIPVAGKDQTVAWAWERPDGGRSFGFSGAHFHENWKYPEYRRLAAQGLLWSVGLPVPEGGLPVGISEQDLALPPQEK